MIKFDEFINENKFDKINTDKLTYDDFLKSITDSCEKDFNMTNMQAIEFTILYKDLLRDAWENGFTTREAIASTKRPGIIIKDGTLEESYIFQIDDIYEAFIEAIETEIKPENIKSYVDDYFNRFNNNYSDKRIFERVKNNYKRLKLLAENRLNETSYTKDGDTFQVDVIERNDEMIDEVISDFSFVYKKKKDRYVRPTKITGKTIYKDIELEITLSNKDIVKITYNDTKKAFSELQVHINNKLVYHMDYIELTDIIKKSASLYKNYLGKQNFKLVQKPNPFE